MTAIQSAFRQDCHPCPPVDTCNPTHASTKMECGKAVFENDNYHISMGDNNEINIHNKNTGEDYQIWGDPHVNVDGQHAFDFWGTTTFELDDGTKLTVDTTPAAGNADVTLASRVTITNGDYGVRVSGIDTNTTGDLKIDEAKGWGELLDAVTKDGNVLQENPTCKGFLAVDDNGRIHAVDQNYINQTDEKKNCHPPQQGGADQLGKMEDRFKEAFRLLEGLIRIVFSGSFPSQHCPEREPEPGCRPPQQGGVQPQPQPAPAPAPSPVFGPLPFLPMPTPPALPQAPVFGPLPFPSTPVQLPTPAAPQPQIPVFGPIHFTPPPVISLPVVDHGGGLDNDAPDPGTCDADSDCSDAAADGPGDSDGSCGVGDAGGDGGTGGVGGADGDGGAGGAGDGGGDGGGDGE